MSSSSSSSSSAPRKRSGSTTGGDKKRRDKAGDVPAVPEDYAALKAQVEAQAAQLRAMERERDELYYRDALEKMQPLLVEHWTRFLHDRVFPNARALRIEVLKLEAPLLRPTQFTFQDTWHGSYWPADLLTLVFKLFVRETNDADSEKTAVGRVVLRDGPPSLREEFCKDKVVELNFADDYKLLGDYSVMDKVVYPIEVDKRAHCVFALDMPQPLQELAVGKLAPQWTSCIVNLLAHSPRDRFDLAELLWAMAAYPVDDDHDESKDWRSDICGYWICRADGSYSLSPAPMCARYGMDNTATIARLQRLWRCAGAWSDLRAEANIVAA